MQDRTAFKCHGRARIVVFGQFGQVLGLAREKATVNKKVRFPGQNSDISVFETEAKTTLHARTEDCCGRWCPRSRDSDLGRDVL